MTSEVRMVLQDIFVYEQPDFVFWVVHQTENTYRTGSDVKVLFHKFRFGKGKTALPICLERAAVLNFLLPGRISR